ncbi:MAG: cytochrome c3 family protein [Verrucomicrobiota bacterium]
MTVTAIAAVAVAVGIISCATVDRVVIAPPMIAGAKYVGMDQCALCHEKQVKDFNLTQHSRIQLRETVEKDEVQGLGCEGCHGPGSLHVDAGGGKKGDRLIISGKDPESCFQCHLDKKAEFSLQFHHPVKEGKMDCTACHNPHGANIQASVEAPMNRANETCAACHRNESRPHVFEHEALREGCVSCHNPHGSINPKLLVQRDNNLCLKCHAQVALGSSSGTTSIGKMPHAGFGPTEFLKQGTCFSAGCHTAVHGSDVNTHLRY